MKIFFKFLTLIVILLLFAGSVAAQAPAPIQTYSLSVETAQALAFQNNKDLQIQAKEVDVARALILGSRSAFLPQVSTSAGYTRNSSILSLASSSGAKKDPRIYTGYINDNKAGIAVTQTVYNGGANLAQMGQAKLNFSAQAQNLRLRKHLVVFETKRLYYGLLLAQDTARIAQNLIDLAQSHYEDVQKKFSAGVVSRFDVLQSKVQVSKLTPELIRAKNAVDLISAELKRLLGLKQDDVLTLTDTLTYSPIAIKEKDFLSAALLANPEMALQSLGVDTSNLGIDLARSGGHPQVNAGLGLNYRSNDVADMFNSPHESWNAGFSITMPIFDGFSSKAKVDQAKAKYAQAILSKENAGEEIAVNIKRATLDLAKAAAQINSQKESIDEAKESLRLAQVRYDNGEGTNLDVLEAQVSLSQVEKIYSAGIFDYLMAEAYLNRVMGIDRTETAAISATHTP